MGVITIESWKNADKDNKFQQREQIGRIKTAALLSNYRGLDNKLYMG